MPVLLDGALQTLPASPVLTATTSTTTATMTWVINRRHPSSRGHPDRDMSYRDDEVTVGGAGFGLQGGEQTSVHQAGSAAPRGPSLGPEPGAL